MRISVRAPQRTKTSPWLRALAIIGDAGSIFMSLRDRPRPLDWAAAAVRAASLAAKIKAERLWSTPASPWSYFDADDGDSEWIEVPPEFRRRIIEQATDLEFDETHWNGDLESTRVVLGTIDGERVGWLQAGDQLCDGPYIVRVREDETYAAVGRAIWRQLGTDHCAYGSQGLVRDAFADAPRPCTGRTERLRARIAAFRAHGLARSVLLVGPPGTGKSHAIATIAASLGVRTLRIELSALLDGRRVPDDGIGENLDTVIRMLEPHAIVFDDIDRVGNDARLLWLLEQASRQGRIVLASANGTTSMVDALLRPGRFDEIVTFDSIERDVLTALLGPDADLVDRIAQLPIAYAREFAARLRVLGRDAALAELDELVERASQV